jgi:hypothetical protein
MTKPLPVILASKIEARKNFLRKVVLFVFDLTLSRGEVTKRTKEGCFSCTTSQLDMGGLSFEVELNNGGRKYLRVYRAKPKECLSAHHLMLDVCWFTPSFSPDECRVDTFDKTISWLSALDRVMRNERNRRKKRERAELKAEQVEKRQWEKLDKEIVQANLQEVARRLAVS